jgi:flagellin-specific chaperone FliS
MWIAEQKKKTNIAEYVLYMWQIEDLIRSFNLDLLQIEEKLLVKYKLDETQENQLFEWYKSLVNDMRKEGIADKGHLKITTEIIAQLSYIHETLLHDKKDFEYTELFKRCEPIIKELKEKSGATKDTDIHICFNGLYGMLVMRLQQKNILKETEDAFKVISKLIANLVSEYTKAFNF